MSFSLPLKKMPNVNRSELFDGIQRISTMKSIVYYVIDSRYRNSVNVRQAYGDWIEKKKWTAPKFFGTQKEIVRQSLDYVRSVVTYKSDQEEWNATEKWNYPDETIFLKVGDCEDGAWLLMEILRQNGIPSNQVYLVAGDVIGGGHAYVLWYSDEDMVAYTVDWCYWSSDSLFVPYEENPKYFGGRKEWFRFNWDGSFVKK